MFIRFTFIFFLVFSLNCLAGSYYAKGYIVGMGNIS